MQKTSFKYFPKLPRITEISNTHCGPATLRMLLVNTGVQAGQRRIVNESSSVKRLLKYGMNVFELAKATKKISPKVQFWFKDNADLQDVRKILEEYNYPVGIEWQGDFKQFTDENNGHYSVITHISKNGKTVFIADPFFYFAGKDRRVKTFHFEKLWWDDNEIVNPKTKKLEKIKDYHMIFIVAPKHETFPVELEMTKG